MWLLDSSTQHLHEFIRPDVPRYAVFSHTWEEGEILMRDLEDPLVHEQRGFEKIRQCCRLAQADGIQWVWMDTCCLDDGLSKNRWDNKELSESINSMYSWFENAAVCYTYLSDVSSSMSPARLLRELQSSRYFTRKWTLQELVAPSSISFFDKDWQFIGTRSSLHATIAEATGIQSAVLRGEKLPKQCHVSERMGWAANRIAKEVEDEAYSLIGLFDINMPIRYGEGSQAFRRLQEEISKTHYASILDTSRTGMRLLVTNSEPLEIKKFVASDTPEYAILSHTWGDPNEEVSFSDMCQGLAKTKTMYRKVKKACDLAASHGFEYLWIDTCCIDKSSSAELQEAICSMYRWYKCARICYVYLEDCEASSVTPNFWHSRWFTRGWTLQELIAPTHVEFYDKEWNEIGTKQSLCGHIADVTSIDPAILRGSDPTGRTVAERMSWAASRSTTRIEDSAYCLMGLFGVNMPMLYGEGLRAFSRLQEEIMKQTEDYTIFAWKASFMSGNYRGILATSPDEFRGSKSITSGDYRADRRPLHPPTLTSRGLLIELPLLSGHDLSKPNETLAWVGSSRPAQHVIGENAIACISLRTFPYRSGVFVRINPGVITFLPRSDHHLFTRERIYVLPFGTATDDASREFQMTKSGNIHVHHQQSIRPALLNHTSDQHYSRVTWLDLNSPTFQYLYSVHDLDSLEVKSYLIGSLFLEKNDDEFVVIVGFHHDNIPWCSVVSMEDLDKDEADGWGELANNIESKFGNNAPWLLSRTDRSSVTLRDGSTIMVAMRVGCPTSANSKYTDTFNLHLRWADTLLPNLPPVLERLMISSTTPDVQISNLHHARDIQKLEPNVIWEDSLQEQTVPIKTSISSTSVDFVATMHPEHRVILAPAPYDKTHPTVFLSGYIPVTTPTWQTILSTSLSRHPITILNPMRSDWDSSWTESLSDPRFAEQVNWEMDGMENADVIVHCFGKNAQGPITLQELGLWAKSGKCVVSCEEGYWKKGNVEAICKRHGIMMLHGIQGLDQAVEWKLRELGKL